MNLAMGEGSNGQKSSISSLQAPGSPGLTASRKASELRTPHSAVCSSASRPPLALVGEGSWGSGGVVEEAGEQGSLRGGMGPTGSSLHPTRSTHLSRDPEVPGTNIVGKGRAGVGAGSSCWRSCGLQRLSGGRERYDRNLIFLHTLSAPHLFLD